MTQWRQLLENLSGAFAGQVKLVWYHVLSLIVTVAYAVWRGIFTRVEVGLEETRSALRRMAQVVSLHNRTAEQRTAKRLCMTNVTGLLLTSFAVIFTKHYCVYHTWLLSSLSDKVCRLLSSAVLLRKLTNDTLLLRICNSFVSMNLIIAPQKSDNVHKATPWPRLNLNRLKMAALFIVFYFTGHSHLLLLSRTLHGECVFLSRIIQNYSSDWLFCLWTEISDMSCVVWISGVSEGEGGRRGKENQKGRQWREKKLFTLFPLLLSVAPKEGHILKLDSRFMAAALKLFYCSRNLCVYDPWK